MSLPKPVNMPPNKPFASLMTSHNRGIATANIIKANRMKKSVFKMLPIAWYSITFYHKPPHNHTPHSVLLFYGDDERTHSFEYNCSSYYITSVYKLICPVFY